MNTHKRLCVIDDDPVFTFLLAKMIEKFEDLAKSVFFENGQEAIDYLRTHATEEEALPDLILLDINMPILDGWQFIEAYADLEPSLSKPITIYMISSSREMEDQERALATGYISEYIQKPVYANELQEIITKMIAGS
jgi:CheY-like chemotaxis protein